ncbi:hypothetical protein [Microcystis phage Mvi-JY20]|uniref:Uncharacterized protein n=1 Tax=Microcystis phage Mvi-JY20 TaxID=3128146 RepID=A0AAX4QH40_9CAUD
MQVNVAQLLLNHLVEVVIGSGVLLAAAKYVKQRLDLANAGQSLLDIGAVYTTIQQYRTVLDAQQVHVISFENNGGVPSPTSPLFWSVRYESYDSDEHGPVQETRQRLPANGVVVDMLTTALKAPRDVHKVTQVPEDDPNATRTMYKLLARDGVICGYYAMIGRNRTQSFLVFVTFAQQPSDTNKTEITIAQLADALTKLFKVEK